jgi:hypothetical protein
VRQTILPGVIAYIPLASNLADILGTLGINLDPLTYWQCRLGTMEPIVLVE